MLIFLPTKHKVSISFTKLSKVGGATAPQQYTKLRQCVLSSEKRRQNHGSDGSLVALLKLLLLVEENCYPFASFYS